MPRRFSLILLFSGLSMIAYNQTRNLDFYLKEGVQNSPLLNDYRNQIKSADADSLLIWAAKKPYVEAKSQILIAPGYDVAITNGGNYMAVLGVTQNIFNRREIDNKFKSVYLQKKLVNNSSRISVTELNKTITTQYLVTYSDYNDLSFNKSFLELFRRENEIVSQFVKSGVAKQTDYLSLLVETQSQEILVNQLNSQYRKDLMMLNQLCGLNDSTLYELAGPQILIKGSPDIAKSPSYIQYKIDSLRIENQKRTIDIRYNPKVSWFADGGVMTSNPLNFNKNVGVSAGINLNIPIYDGKQRGIEKSKLSFDENTRKTYEDFYFNQYFQQIQQLSDELKALNDMSVQMENQLKSSDQLVKALKEQLEAGNIQMTDYLNALKNFKTISRNINLVKIQKLQVINDMNFFLTQ